MGREDILNSFHAEDSTIDDNKSCQGENSAHQDSTLRQQAEGLGPVQETPDDAESLGCIYDITPEEHAKYISTLVKYMREKWQNNPFTKLQKDQGSCDLPEVSFDEVLARIFSRDFCALHSRVVAQANVPYLPEVMYGKAIAELKRKHRTEIEELKYKHNEEKTQAAEEGRVQREAHAVKLAELAKVLATEMEDERELRRTLPLYRKARSVVGGLVSEWLEAKVARQTADVEMMKAEIGQHLQVVELAEGRQLRTTRIEMAGFDARGSNVKMREEEIVLLRELLVDLKKGHLELLARPSAQEVLEDNERLLDYPETQSRKRARKVSGSSS